MAGRRRDRRRLRRGSGPGRGAGHVPGGQLDPDQSGVLRSVQHGLRLAVPAAGRPGRSWPRCSGARLTRRMGIKRIFILGLAADFAAMALALPQPVRDRSRVARLRDAPARDHQPRHRLRPDRALGQHVSRRRSSRSASSGRSLYLNALLGLGTALAPLFVAIFLGLGFWWGLPLLVAILLAGLVVAALACPCRSRRRAAERSERRRRSSAPRAAAPVLDLRRVRAAVRHRRDDERQLGDAVHDHRTSGPRRRSHPSP